MFLDSRTVLVGDSLTCMLIAQWLRPGNLLGGAGRIAAPSSAVTFFFEDWWPLEPLEQNSYYCEASPGLEGLSFAEAVEATAGKYTRVLFLMGSNGAAASPPWRTTPPPSTACWRTGRTPTYTCRPCRTPPPGPWRRSG